MSDRDYDGKRRPMPSWLKWVWRLFITIAALFALMVALGLWLGPAKPNLTPVQIAEGRGCLDDKGSIPDMEAKVRAQFADPEGFRVDGAVELLRGDVNDPAIPKDTSLALMRVAGKNRFGGLSFFAASGALHIKDCTVTMFEVKEEQ